MTGFWRIEVHDTLDSTQDFLRQKAMDGAPDGTVIQALTQTKGQGRQGRSWESPKGNLYMSILMRPKVPRHEAPQMAFVAGLAVYDAAATYIKKEHLTLKWPNDILRRGDKLAGILIEMTDEETMLIGIGMNVRSAPAKIGAALGDFSITGVRDRVLEKFQASYVLWNSRGFPYIRARWLKHSYPVGTPMSAGGIDGKFDDVDHDGTLLLRDSENKLHRITAGDVNLVIGQ